VAGWLSSRRAHLSLLAAIVGIGLLARAWGLAWGLADGSVSSRTHPDEWTVYWLFRWFEGYGSLNPCPRPDTSCFFDWGTAFPYAAFVLHWLLMPVYWVLPASTFGAHADQFFVHAVLAGRLVSVIASTATILVAYRLAALAFGPATGLLAALLVSLSGLLIQLAHFATPDATTVFLMSLSLLATYHAYRSPGTRSFLIAGAAIGAATGSEYHMGLLILPLTVAWLLSPVHPARWLGAAAAAAAVTFLVLNPYVLVELPPFLGALEHSIRIRTVDSQIQYQNRWTRYGPAWLFVARYALGYGVGYALTIWMLFGAVVAALRRRAVDWILLSWIAPYFVLVTLSPAKFMRYSAPLLVPLAILGARAAVELATGSLRVRRVVLAAAMGFAVLYSATYDAAYAGLFASPDTRLAVERWTAQHVAPQSEIAFEQPADGLVNLPVFLADVDVRQCFAEPIRMSLMGTPYVALDDFALDEDVSGNGDDLTRFRAAVMDGGRYRLVYDAHYTPTFLGLSFPIDGSPHDWRYPSHHVALYELRSATTVDPTGCLKTSAATRARLDTAPQPIP
jgi:hypothetical protein